MMITAKFSDTTEEVVYRAGAFQGYYANPRSGVVATSGKLAVSAYRAGGWIDSEHGGSIADAVWVGGDIRGLGFASLAISHGRRAAEEIHADLCKIERSDYGSGSDWDVPAVNADFYPGREAPPIVSLSAEEALADPDAEVTATLEENAFLGEVASCFSCGLCFGCQHCWMYCSAGGFAKVVEARPGAYFTVTLDACESCGKCVDVCPCGFLEFDTEATGSGLPEIVLRREPIEGDGPRSLGEPGGIHGQA